MIFNEEKEKSSSIGEDFKNFKIKEAKPELKILTDSVFQPEKTLCLLLRNNYCPVYENKRNKGQFDIISKGLLL